MLCGRGLLQERSQIVVVTLGSAAENGKLCEKLTENGVVVANR